MKLLLNMSVRRASVLGVAVLVLAFVTLAWQTLKSYQDVVLSSAESVSIAGLNILSDGMADVSLERGVTTYQLMATGPLDPTLATRLTAARAKSDVDFEGVRKMSAAHQQTASIILFRSEFERAMQSLARLRASVDQQASMPYADRDQKVLPDLPDGFTTVLRSLEGLRLLLNEPQARITFQTRALLDLSRTAWRIRDIGGVQRWIFSVALANHAALTQEKLDTYRALGRQVDATNDALAQILAMGGFPAAVTDAYHAMEDSYFGGYTRLRNRLCEGAVTGNYDVSFADYVNQSDAPVKATEVLVRVALDAALDAIDEDASASLQRFVAGIAALSVVTLGMVWLAWFLRVRLANRLQAMADVTRALADGRLDQDLERFAAADEVGQVASAMAVLRDAARERVRLEAATGVEQAERQRRSEKLSRLADGFSGEVRATLDGVSHASTQLRETARGLSAGALDASAQASSVSSSADLASANVQTVAAAAEELSSSIQEITRQITRSAAVANQAVGEAAATTTAVTELADATARIDDVVRLISDIAGRTNLLALNATIEAARAGDAGKGFAVVASEVKSLATQTARATDDIATQINAMQAVAGRAVAAIRRIDETIGSMNEISTAIAASMEEQGQATAEIARNVQEAAASTSSMTGSLLTVTDAIARSTEASGKVLSAAEEMSASSQAIQARVDRYFSEMKAA